VRGASLGADFHRPVLVALDAELLSELLEATLSLERIERGIEGGLEIGACEREHERVALERDRFRENSEAPVRGAGGPDRSELVDDEGSFVAILALDADASCLYAPAHA
jgi:hypothetical protein